jgi:acid phosphatase family membrane protein YuiD
VLLAGIFSWFFAQFIKTVIHLLTRKVKSFRDVIELLVWRTGGMPSSHSALVTSLSTSIGIRNGLESDLFVLSLFFALVVIRDAVGVRRSSGIQAKKINEMGDSLSQKKVLSYRPIKEVDGHKPIEVIVGALLGVSMSFAFFYL